MTCKRLLTLLILSSFGLSSLAEARLPPIKPGVPGKKRGDIIAPMLDEQVAAWCDFNKQIIVTRTNVLCAYVGEKAGLAAAASAAPVVVMAAPLAPPTPKKLIKSKPVPKDLAPTLYEMSEYGDA